MVYVRFLVMLLISTSHLKFPTVYGGQQKTLIDLRQFKVAGVGGRFVVKRDALIQELQNRKQQDHACGKDVELQLPGSLTHSSYNESLKGEVTLFYETVTDLTLAYELPDCLKEQFATSYQTLLVAIPVIIGMSGEHGMLPLHLFTNSTKNVSLPYSTSIRQVTYVDSIEEEDDSRVTLQLGGDVLTFQVQDDVKDKEEVNVGKDFDKVNGKIIRFTSYPVPFDWDCERFGSQVSFCQALNEVRCEISAFEEDICTITSTSSSERSPATMIIVNMTGIFQEMFPYLAASVPSKSVEAEILDREHATGIKYPCLTL